MLRRKTPQADLENKRSAWRALGFVASLSLILSALAWTSYDVAITRALDFEADLLEDEASFKSNSKYRCSQFVRHQALLFWLLCTGFFHGHNAIACSGLLGYAEQLSRSSLRHFGMFLFDMIYFVFGELRQS